jgi:hypothetical protein
MTPHPLVATAEAQPAVHSTTEGASQPAPTIHQERVADDLFSPQTARLAAAFLGVHTGAAFLHHLIVEATAAPEEEHPPRRPEKRDPEAR